ncbi:EKC/KEOPS complex subunit LAGE3-like [Acanthaster planci]|uniref:L antigen family member 3 n=1 Tax=Acanthaster planci TaxID=133434 RepID=A0A8B7ZUF9_ACAPL|nr:EKC/KEOPS complex subunit LAGE3-like [Acanthaster planci]
MVRLCTCIWECFVGNHVGNMAASMDRGKHECDLSIPFPSAKEAEIAYNTLKVDKEPRKEVTKELQLHENTLKARFTATEARLLRVAVGSFMDYLNLTIQTMEHFGPPMKRVR